LFFKMTRTESEVISVLVRYSTSMLGNILEWDICKELKRSASKKSNVLQGLVWNISIQVERSSLSVMDVPVEPGPSL
ncbi:21607_t:CDS:2, partial [Gigaspora margarita]